MSIPSWTGRILTHVAGDLEHHDSPDLDHWLEKQNRYTTAEAIYCLSEVGVGRYPTLVWHGLTAADVAEEEFQSKCLAAIDCCLFLLLAVQGNLARGLGGLCLGTAAVGCDAA